MSIAVGLLITGIAAWAMRNAILVEWNLRRLETADDETRHQAVRALGGLQSPRAMTPLLELVESQEDFRVDAAEALEQILPFATPEQHEEAARVLIRTADAAYDHTSTVVVPFDIFREDPDHPEAVLRRLAPLLHGGYDAFIAELRGADSQSGRRYRLLSRSLLESSPHSARAVGAYLDELEPDAAATFFRAHWFDAPNQWTHRQPGGPFAFPTDLVPAEPQKAVALAREIALNGPSAKTRAVALSFAFYCRRDKKELLDGEILVSALDDSDPLVRRAAIRICGFLRGREPAFDVAPLLYRDEHPSVLAATIRARQLWTEDSIAWAHSFELFDGLVCEWAPKGDPSVKGKLWTTAERHRLGQLLRTSDRLRSARRRVAGSGWRVDTTRRLWLRGERPSVHPRAARPRVGSVSRDEERARATGRRAREVAELRPRVARADPAAAREDRRPGRRIVQACAVLLFADAAIAAGARSLPARTPVGLLPLRHAVPADVSPPPRLSPQHRVPQRTTKPGADARVPRQHRRSPHLVEGTRRIQDTRDRGAARRSAASLLARAVASTFNTPDRSWPRPAIVTRADQRRARMARSARRLRREARAAVAADRCCIRFVVVVEGAARRAELDRRHTRRVGALPLLRRLDLMPDAGRGLVDERVASRVIARGSKLRRIPGR